MVSAIPCTTDYFLLPATSKSINITFWSCCWEIVLFCLLLTVAIGLASYEYLEARILSQPKQTVSSQFFIMSQPVGTNRVNISSKARRWQVFA
jgi:hypothetical protein